MSGPLNSIFAAVDTAVATNLATLSLTANYATTGADRFVEGAPCRVTWVPLREKYYPARGQGGDVAIDSAGNMNLPGGANKPLMTAGVEVAVDLWGTDRDTVESMRNCFLSALHDTLSAGSIGEDLIVGEWLEPEATTKDGEILRLMFPVFVPVTRVEPTTTTATINSIPITPSSTFHVGS